MTNGDPPSSYFSTSLTVVSSSKVNSLLVRLIPPRLTVDVVGSYQISPESQKYEKSFLRMTEG